MYHVIINGNHHDTRPAHGTAIELQHSMSRDGSYVRVIEFYNRTPRPRFVIVDEEE